MPTAPTRHSSREHIVRVPNSFGYSALKIPDEPYSQLINSDHAMKMGEEYLTSSEIEVLLHVADAAWRTTIDHLARANAATPLNVNPDGSPLTYRTATHGEESEKWKDEEDTEIDSLLETKTLHPIHLHQQLLDRRGDSTYYNPKPKEKYDYDMHKVYRIPGTAGGDRINYDGPTKANTAALSTVKILLQSVVSDDADWMTLDIKDFYLMTPLQRPEYIRIPLKFLFPKIITQHSLQPFVHNNSILFEVTKSMYGLPHAGKIAQDVLIGRLAKHGYLQTGTTCLFRHVTKGVAFALVADDFAVKFKDLVSIEHLIACLELFYKLTIKRNATKYLGRISAPGVIPLLFSLVHQPFTSHLDLGKKRRNQLPQIHRPFLLLKNIIAYNKLVECYYIIVWQLIQPAYLQ